PIARAAPRAARRDRAPRDGGCSDARAPSGNAADAAIAPMAWRRKNRDRQARRAPREARRLFEHAARAQLLNVATTRNVRRRSRSADATRPRRLSAGAFARV